MKQNFIKVLNKINLGGIVEEATASVEKNSATIHFRSNTMSVMGVATMSNFPHADLEFGIPDISKISQALNPMDNDVKIDIQLNPTVSDKMYIKFADKDVENHRAICLTSDINNVFKGSNFDESELDIEFKVDEDFFKKMNKIKNIKSADNIAFIATSKTDGKLIVNHSEINTDTGFFKIDLESGTKMSEPMLFNFDVFLKVLFANSDMKVSKIQISTSLNVIKFSFESDDKVNTDSITTQYYMIALA